MLTSALFSQVEMVSTRSQQLLCISTKHSATPLPGATGQTPEQMQTCVRQLPGRLRTKGRRQESRKASRVYL